MVSLLTHFVVMTCVTLSYGQSSSCRTPSGDTGNCSELKQCTPLKNLSAKRSKTQEDIQLLRLSACGFTPDGRPKVCCPTDWEHWTTPQPKPTTETTRPKPTEAPRPKPTEAPRPKPTEAPIITKIQPTVAVVPLTLQVNSNEDCPATHGSPGFDCCGKDAVGGNRITGGTLTGLDEYPWLALLEYHRDLVYPDGKVVKKIQTLCGGSLISSLYVLTAAHCVKSTFGTLTNVRLAEYNTSSAPKDCVETEGGGLDCSIVLVVPIERTIVHPQYSPQDDNRRNDVSLLRLQFAAPYTDFIRPICLPSKDVTVAPAVNQSFIVAGWGSTGTVFSEIKLHAKIPYVAMSNCSPHYESAKQKINLWTRQICAGGQGGRDTCGGDSGGPLMYENGPNFEIMGIVSFGPTHCGLDGVPAVYTYVYEYLDWIKSEMRP